MWLKAYEAFKSKGMAVKLGKPLKIRAEAKTDKLESKIMADLTGTCDEGSAICLSQLCLW
jgi:hypothetical protein